MATCAISGTLQDPGGVAVVTANIRFAVVVPQLAAAILLVPRQISTTTDSSGNFTLTLVQGISGTVIVEYPPNSSDAIRRYEYAILVPTATTAAFSSLITEL